MTGPSHAGGPLHAETDAIRGHAAALETAADDATRALAASRDAAAPAAPGFPGDAAGPFAALLRGLEDSDRALVNAITDAAGHVVSDAGTYDAQDAAHADLYRAVGP